MVEAYQSYIEGSNATEAYTCLPVCVYIRPRGTRLAGATHRIAYSRSVRHVFTFNHASTRTRVACEDVAMVLLPTLRDAGVVHVPAAAAAAGGIGEFWGLSAWNMYRSNARSVSGAIGGLTFWCRVACVRWATLVATSGRKVTLCV